MSQQQPGNIPLLPPPKQPTLASCPGGPPAQASQAAGVKPKSKKVCVLLGQLLGCVMCRCESGKIDVITGFLLLRTYCCDSTARALDRVKSAYVINMSDVL